VLLNKGAGISAFKVGAPGDLTKLHNFQTLIVELTLIQVWLDVGERGTEDIPRERSRVRKHGADARASGKAKAERDFAVQSDGLQLELDAAVCLLDLDNAKRKPYDHRGEVHYEGVLRARIEAGFGWKSAAGALEHDLDDIVGRECDVRIGLSFRFSQEGSERGVRDEEHMIPQGEDDAPRVYDELWGTERKQRGAPIAK
jgi:hypothetical protein